MKTNKKITIKYIEEFKTNIPNTNESELKIIFNKKYLNYIKNIEKRNLETE